LRVLPSCALFLYYISEKQPSAYVIYLRKRGDNPQTLTVEEPAAEAF